MTRAEDLKDVLAGKKIGKPDPLPDPRKKDETRRPEGYRGEHRR